MKTILGKIGSLPDKAVIGLAIVLTLLISGLLLYLMAWPSFNNIGTNSTDIKVEEARLTAVTESISMLSKEDKSRLESLVSFMQQLVPETVDNLHFATLNELVAEAAGVTVNGIQISKGAAPSSSKAVTTAPGVETSGKAAPATPVQTSQVAAVSIAVTYTSGFDSLLNLIKYWTLADQLVGIKEVNISGVAAGSLNYTVSYELPTSPKIQKATVEDKLGLTEAQKKKIEEIESRIIYTATPSANTVGKSNPFE